MLCNFAPATLSQFAIHVDTAVLPALEGGKVHQPCCKVILHHKDTGSIEKLVCQTVSTPWVVGNQSHDFKQHKATTMDQYQITLIYLENRRFWVNPWLLSKKLFLQLLQASQVWLN